MGDARTSPNTALILVGGFGTRLRSVVSDRPKALAMIAGRPFLAWQLDALAAQGISRAVLCTHHLSELIEAEFPLGPLANGITIVHSREPEPMGTGGALRLGLEHAGADANLVVGINGDTFCAFDLANFYATHGAAGARASILLTQVADGSRYGTVDCDGTTVTGFREKAAAPPEPGWINAGIYLLSRAVLETLPPGMPASIERDCFPRWVGHGLCAHRGGSRFLDIGTPESFADAERFLAEEWDAALFSGGSGRGSQP